MQTRWYYGVGGSGKTRAIINEFGDHQHVIVYGGSYNTRVKIDESGDHPSEKHVIVYAETEDASNVYDFLKSTLAKDASAQPEVVIVEALFPPPDHIRSLLGEVRLFEK
jgi:hypothetical protein